MSKEADLFNAVFHSVYFTLSGTDIALAVASFCWLPGHFLPSVLERNVRSGLAPIS